MKYFLYIAIGLAAVALLYFGVFNRYDPSSANIEQPKQQVSKAQTAWETQADDQLPVTIKVTPIEFGKSVNIWKFDIAFDTHTGSLDDDLLRVVTLSDDKGNVYQPISWEGPGPGGHHREGILIFNAVIPAPSYVELKIKKVGGVPKRSFKWNME